MIRYIITMPSTSSFYKIFIGYPFSGFEINKKVYKTAKEAVLDLLQITDGSRCKIIIK